MVGGITLHDFFVDCLMVIPSIFVVLFAPHDYLTCNKNFAFSDFILRTECILNVYLKQPQERLFYHVRLRVKKAKNIVHQFLLNESAHQNEA